MLPDLTLADCEAIGYRVGEANVLPSEWDATFERECQFARQQKARRMRRPGESDDEFIARIATYNAELRAKEMREAFDPTRPPSISRSS
jgi:hypothetical protein